MGSSSQTSRAGPIDRPKRLGGDGGGASARIVRQLPFFALFFLYLWLAVEPHLLFHGADRITNFPSFYTTRRFLASHLSRPGGLVDYLSAFLSQLFYISWLGALVITIQAWALGWSAAYLLRTMGLKRLDVTRYVPALLLLIVYGRYTYFFPTTLALLCALTLACVHVRLTVGRTPLISVMSFVGLSLACHYAAGGAVLLFGLLCVIRELVLPGRRRLAVPYVLVAVGWPYIFGVTVLGLSMGDAYGDLLPISWKLLHYDARRRGVETLYILYLLVPGLMVAGGIVSALWTRWTRNRRAGDAKGARVGGRGAVGWRWLESPARRRLVHGGVLIVVGAVVAYGSFDRTQKTRLAVDYCAYHERWASLLAQGQKARDDPLVVHAVNRALYHTGQLGEAMFAWPQDPTYLFLTGAAHRWAYWRSFAVHLEMGLINMAEDALMECLAGLGDRPMILQQLARINLAKGNLGTARVYLHALRATLFHRAWARRYLQLMERDPDLTPDRDIQHLRSLTLEADYPSLRLPTETMLTCLLEKNGRNRMAFEYLMAWHLLNRQLSRFVKRLDALDDLGYATLPRHYEEAILVYAATERTTLQLRGYPPRDAVREAMEDFLGILRRHGGDRQAALSDLARYHGGTYAFYNVYGPREKAR